VEAAGRGSKGSGNLVDRGPLAQLAELRTFNP
jgi:hypothetical protein